MDGISMMLKAAGFDPAVIKQQIGEFQQNLAATIQHFDSRLENQQKSIDAFTAIVAKQTEVIMSLSAQIATLKPEVSENGPGNGN
jgi:uncharacterized coiled-coil protein SlyX